MRKLSLIIGLIAAVNILFAQEGREMAREKAEVRFEEYKDRLNLTDEQLADLKQVKEDMRPEMEALKNDESLSRSDKMRAHADLIEKREAEVAEILDDEQLAELAIIKEEVKANKQRRKSARKARRGDGR